MAVVELSEVKEGEGSFDWNPDRGHHMIMDI